MAEEPVRQRDFAGFAGLAEHRSQGRAGEVARRHFRAWPPGSPSCSAAGEFDLLALGGSQANVDGLAAELPPDLAARPGGHLRGGPGHGHPGRDPGPLRRRWPQEYEGRADEQVGRRPHGSGRVAGARGAGLDRVLDAANQHAVDLLLLDAGETVPGIACPSCGWLARAGAACPSCGAATRRVADLFDAAAEAARADGGAVRYVLAATPLAHCRGGALVRFPVAVVGQ